MAHEKKDVIEGPQLEAAVAALPDWRTSDTLLLAAFGAPSAAVALELIAAIGRAAESANHHPDVDWRYDHVFVVTTSHDVGGAVTARDLDLAATISALAAEAGAKAEPDSARPGA